MVNQLPVVTVGGFIVADDGAILLVQSNKWKDCYTCPGGKVELGETRQEAFVREVREETGLEVIDVRFALVHDSLFSDQYVHPNHFVMHDFVARLAPGFTKESVVLNDEAHGYLWVRPHEARTLVLSRETYVLLDWYLEVGCKG